jgi:hypothetical protein
MPQGRRQDCSTGDVTAVAITFGADGYYVR